jgi:iron complex outermembrane recepter protein
MSRSTSAAAAALLCCASSIAAAQATKDSTTTDSLRRAGALEGVIVRAVRAGGTAPIAQTSVTRSAIAARSVGQDVPLMLLGTTPSLTAHSESGTNWGYSYLRLRGIDQSRINLSIDGIPLNDPEDQVFYFANFADLSASIQSVQVQRGVGTSGAGTASFAGSINFETKPVFGQRRFAALETQGGSFGSRRAMLEGNTGLMAHGFAASVRVSALRTNSFRNNAGVAGFSGMTQVGWVGSRDVIKASLLAGQLRDTLSYLAVPEAELAVDRRINPLSPEETDRFTQTLASLAHTRLIAPGVEYATTLYRIAAGGAYTVRSGRELTDYNLDFAWYGATSALNVTRDSWRISAGMNANTYARDHHAYAQLDPQRALYFNTGQKRDGSAFLKTSVASGPVTWFGDLQLRHARFRYLPDDAAGFGGTRPSIAWTFVNPRVGATVAVHAQTELFASIGQTTREPTRSDIFGGNDDVTSAALADLGGLNRVRPERVTSTEGGVRWRRATTLSLELNAFRMDFRDEIARIGALSALGAELRSNVGASVRQGIEADLRWRPVAALAITSIASVSHNRIRSFIDSSGATPIARRNVPPLLTPAFTATQRLDWRASRRIEIGAEARHQGVSYLRNDGDRALTLPAFTQVDAQLRIPLRAHDISIRGTNLTNSRGFGSGYAIGTVRNFFILPPRAVFVTVRVATR